MPGEASTKPRASVVTLNKKMLATEAGRDLLDLLRRFTDDGRISEAEVTELRQWLTQSAAAADLPALHFLREQSLWASSRNSRNDPEGQRYRREDRLDVVTTGNGELEESKRIR